MVVPTSLYMELKTTLPGLDFRLISQLLQVQRPVQTLRDSIDRTNGHRCNDAGPVFLELIYPYGALSAYSIGRILCDSLHLAGLSEQGYSSMIFRPANDTTAMDYPMHPKTVQWLGRWKSDAVFYNQYVHSPVSYTDWLIWLISSPPIAGILCSCDNMSVLLFDLSQF